MILWRRDDPRIQRTSGGGTVWQSGGARDESRGIRVNVSNDTTARKRLRAWSRSPPRPGIQLLINPWESRHLRVFGITRIAGGIVAASIGAFILSYSAYGWAAFFLVLGALDLAGGYWYLTIARSSPVRT